TGGRNRPALLADAFESFLGALYLDQGLESVLEFLDQYVFPKITTGAFSHAMDYKSQLQELVQQYNNHSIDYIILEEKGRYHENEFDEQVNIKDDVYKERIGRTKKEAQQRAAKHALDVFND